MPATKLWAYADETGKVARDGFFMVAVIFTADPEAHEAAFVQLERTSQRAGRKWVRTAESAKLDFLEGVGTLLAAVQPVMWRVHPQGGDLVELTAATVADAARVRDPLANYRVQIDGLKPSECDVARRAFSQRNLAYRRVVGGREESSPLLRLADSLVGFLGDLRKGKPYAVPIWPRLQGFFQEI